jgi:hypothetical protein
MAPQKRTPSTGAPGALEYRSAATLIGSRDNKPKTEKQARTVVATIDTGRSAQLRVSPTSAGVTLDVEKLPELIATLRKAEAKAVSAGMLSKGRAAGA